MLISNGPVKYSKVGKRLEWIRTPDGRTIEYPFSFSISRLKIPKHSLIWGLLLGIISLAVGYYAYQQQKVRATTWIKTRATVVSCQQVKTASNRTSTSSKTRYQARLRFSTNTGLTQEVNGPLETSFSSPGQSRDLYYDPKNSVQFSLSSPNPELCWYIAAAFAALFLLLGIAGWIHGPLDRLKIQINNERWLYLDGRLVEGP